MFFGFSRRRGLHTNVWNNNRLRPTATLQVRNNPFDEARDVFGGGRGGGDDFFV